MILPPYQEYEDSNIAWLREIPAHWSVKKIKHTTYLKGRVGWKGLTSNEYLDEGYAYLVTGTDFSGKFIRWTECVCVERERYEDDPFIQLRNGDLLITKDGTIGKLALVSNLDRPACLNSGIFLVRPTSHYSAPFMYWVLSSRIFKVFCDLSSTGSTIQHLYQKVFEEFAFPVPPLSEQHSIAKFLDKETARIDALITEQERLLALLSEKRQATISHAVTRGLDSRVPMKDSGLPWLGEVPAHWQVRPLKAIVSTPITDGPHETPEFLDEGVPFVSAEAVGGGAINFERVRAFISVEDHARYSQKYKPQLYDIYMVKSGATTGVTAMVDGRTDFNIWSPLAAIRCQSHVAEPLFVLNYLRSKNFQEAVALNWSFGTQQNIGMGVLGDLVVALPPVEEQRAIAQHLTLRLGAYPRMREAAERAVMLLQERRSALISAAVSGKIDVRSLVEAPAA